MMNNCIHRVSLHTLDVAYQLISTSNDKSFYLFVLIMSDDEMCRWGLCKPADEGRTRKLSQSHYYLYEGSESSPLL
jgi:hypothetical protein